MMTGPRGSGLMLPIIIVENIAVVFLQNLNFHTGGPGLIPVKCNNLFQPQSYERNNNNCPFNHNISLIAQWGSSHILPGGLNAISGQSNNATCVK